MGQSSVRLKFAVSSGLVILVAMAPVVMIDHWPSVAWAAAERGQPPIDFTPNVEELRLTAIALSAQPSALDGTPPPFGVGFVYTEANRPEYSYIEGGGDEFGYGPTVQDPNVYLIWMTDESGTHYYSVAADSDQLRGTRDPVTGTRDQNGFVHLIADYESKTGEVADQELVVNKHQNARMSWHGGALGAAIAGGIICGILSAGTCFAAFGVAAVGAWIQGAVQNGDKVSAQTGLDVLQGELDRIQANVRGKFEQSVAVGP